MEVGQDRKWAPEHRGRIGYDQGRASSPVATGDRGEGGHRRRQGSRNAFSLYALSGRGQGHSKGLRRDEILDESGKSMKY